MFELLDQFLLNNLWINFEISTPILCCMGGSGVERAVISAIIHICHNGFCVEHSESSFVSKSKLFILIFRLLMFDCMRLVTETN